MKVRYNSHSKLTTVSGFTVEDLGIILFALSEVETNPGIIETKKEAQRVHKELRDALEEEEVIL